MLRDLRQPLRDLRVREPERKGMDGHDVKIPSVFYWTSPPPGPLPKNSVPI